MRIPKIKNINIDIFLFAVALIVFLSGLFLTTGGTEIVVEPRARRAVTLVFSQWWQDELDHNALSVLIAEFERNNPGITIRLDRRSYHEMENMILNGVNDRIAGFSEDFNSDILALDPRWLYGLIQNNMLEPLTPYMEASDFIPALQTGGQERVFSEWALPLVSFMATLFYNTEVLSSAGFDRPPKTRTEFLEFARAITNSEQGRFGTAFALDQNNPQGAYTDIYSWIWASGTLILKDGKSNFTSPQVIETLEFLKKLHQEGLLAPGSFAKTPEEKIEKFVSGKIGMMIAPVQDVEIVRRRMGDAGFGITTIPGIDVYSAKPAFGLTTWYAGISRESKHKSEAWAFLYFLAKRSPVLAAASYAVPGSGNGLEEFLSTDPFYSKAFRIYEGGMGVQEFAGYPAVHVLDFIVREELYNMLEQNQSPRRTAEAIQKRWEEVFQNALRFGS